MTHTTISQIVDNGKLKLVKYGQVIYTKIKKTKEGVVINSDNTGKSYIKKGSTKCWPVRKINKK